MVYLAVLIAVLAWSVFAAWMQIIVLKDRLSALEAHHEQEGSCLCEPNMPFRPLTIHRDRF